MGAIAILNQQATETTNIILHAQSKLLYKNFIKGWP